MDAGLTGRRPSLAQAAFSYRMLGRRELEANWGAHGAIVWTAHMGNYDLGAPFAPKNSTANCGSCGRLKPDVLTARILTVPSAIGRSAVKVDSTPTEPSFPLISQRAAERAINSIQGERVIGKSRRSP